MSCPLWRSVKVRIQLLLWIDYYCLRWKEGSPHMCTWPVTQRNWGLQQKLSLTPLTNVCILGEITLCTPELEFKCHFAPFTSNCVNQPLTLYIKCQSSSSVHLIISWKYINRKAMEQTKHRPCRGGVEVCRSTLGAYKSNSLLSSGGYYYNTSQWIQNHNTSTPPFTSFVSLCSIVPYDWKPP